jgi:hypothetical protein
VLHVNSKMKAIHEHSPSARAPVQIFYDQEQQQEMDLESITKLLVSTLLDQAPPAPPVRVHYSLAGCWSKLGSAGH